jgi:hypothetical protein
VNVELEEGRMRGSGYLRGLGVEATLGAFGLESSEVNHGRSSGFSQGREWQLLLTARRISLHRGNKLGAEGAKKLTPTLASLPRLKELNVR